MMARVRISAGLTAREGLHRLPVGWRIFFDIEPGVIRIRGIDNRGQAY